MITGEAGIGKTRMLAELAARVGDAALFTAAAFPREVDVPGGMVLNLADDIARSGDEARARALRECIMADANLSDDSARRRRVLVGELAQTLESMSESGPTLLMIEDAHWADELSLDVIARLAPVIGSAPCLVVVTYRSDEAAAGSTLAPWRARLLAQRQAEETRLGRLGRDDVAAMAAAITTALPTSAQLDELCERSDGIPLHVEELLTAGAEAVPESIAESVRGRVSRLPADVRNVMTAASVIGRSFDVELLAIVARSPRAEVEDALNDLAVEHLIVGDAAGEVFVFRHALLCDAVYQMIPPRRRRELHAAVARESASRGLAEAMISDHFERGREIAAAHRHALAGARDASGRSAHREAAALYRRAQRTAPADMSPKARARLGAALAAALLAIDSARDAAEQLAAAIELFRDEGDAASAAALVPDLMAARHLLGASLDERSELANDALSWLGLEPADNEVRGALLAALAAAFMLDRRLDEAERFGSRAEAVLHDLDTAADSCASLTVSLDATLGSVLVFGGRTDAGWSRLESAVRVAERARLEREAARAHRLIGSTASVLLEYPRAERYLARGVEYTAQVERWNDHHYLLAHSAYVRWAVGDWVTADQLGQRALAAGDGVTTRITALHARGFVALGRGLWREARQQLEQSRLLAERMGELQRLSPSLWGLAELALGQEDPATAVALSERGLAASRDIDDAAYLFPFVVTGARAHVATGGALSAHSWIDQCEPLLRRRALPGTAAAIAHARGLVATARGESDAACALLADAESQWAATGRWWEGAWALVDLARAALTAGRVEQSCVYAASAKTRAEAVGAAPLVRQAGALLAPRPTMTVLSVRERDVARLIAAGATNRSIAERLVIAPKTVSAHVEHILTKLGASRRAEIAAWVARSEPPTF